MHLNFDKVKPKSHFYCGPCSLWLFTSARVSWRRTLLRRRTRRSREVYLFPLNGNITSKWHYGRFGGEKRVGIGGVLYMDSRVGACGRRATRWWRPACSAGDNSPGSINRRQTLKIPTTVTVLINIKNIRFCPKEKHAKNHCLYCRSGNYGTYLSAYFIPCIGCQSKAMIFDGLHPFSAML